MREKVGQETAVKPEIAEIFCLSKVSVKGAHEEMPNLRKDDILILINVISNR
jgi:hypothetical protein